MTQRNGRPSRFSAFAALAVLLPTLSFGATRTDEKEAPEEATVARTFTTIEGSHFFNGSALVTCHTPSDCVVRKLKARDVVPLAADQLRLLILDNTFQVLAVSMRTCTLDLADCRPIFVQGFPGAKQLTPTQTLLQAGKYPCGYVPSKGVNCGFARQESNKLTDVAKAHVGQLGVTQSAIRNSPAGRMRAQFLFGCQANCGTPSGVLIEPVTMEALWGDGSNSDRGGAGDGGGGYYDDSEAFGETGNMYDHDPILATAAQRNTCYTNVCGHNYDVNTDQCVRLTAGLGMAAVPTGVLAGGVAFVFTEETGPLAFVVATRVFKYTTGGMAAFAGMAGGACTYMASANRERCFALCDISYAGPTAVKGRPQ